MTSLDWLENIKPKLLAKLLEDSVSRDQLETILEIAYKSGYKLALESQASAEPVAWEHTFRDGLKIFYPHKEYLDLRVSDIKPLYRYPPPREPLTDKQIDMLTDRHWGRGTVKPAYNLYRQYVRAVEKMHGI